MSLSYKKSARNLFVPLAEINVTPFVDVMLVLLVIFMVTAPMLAQSINVDLPKASSAERQNRKDPIVVTLDKSGAIYLGKELVPREEIVAAVQARADSQDALVVHIQGDKNVAFGDAVALMDQFVAHKITRIGIMVDRNNPKVEGPARE